MSHCPVIVIGGGPAGLTASYELSNHNIRSVVLEGADKVGGIARTETYKGYRFDIGGHRFYTKVEIVDQLWHEVLGNDFISVPRLSRIYYQGRFFNYPLEAYNALFTLGIIDSALILLSYFKAKLRPSPAEDNFEQWVSNRFGRRLYRTFFQTYTEKVWGISCKEIQAEWAAQRIKGLSLKKAIINALFGKNDTKTLIKEFYYPVLGPGMMWERFQQCLEERGSSVYLNSKVIGIQREGTHINRVRIDQAGKITEMEADNFISSMPITALVRQLDPPAPKEVLDAINRLSYRSFLIVALIIDTPKLFPDNWIYIHSPAFQVGRIQNFKNWSPAMVPDPRQNLPGNGIFL